VLVGSGNARDGAHLVLPLPWHHLGVGAGNLKEFISVRRTTFTLINLTGEWILHEKLGWYIDQN
jgi:hypothetical protein